MTTGFLRYLTMLTPSASRDSTVIRTVGQFDLPFLRYECDYSRLDDTLMNRAQVFRQPGGCSSSVARSIHRGKPSPKPEARSATACQRSLTGQERSSGSTAKIPTKWTSRAL